MDESPTSPRDYQSEADALLADAVAGLPAEQTALLLAVLINRAAARLHNVARAGAAEAKDTPAWPTWAQLGNASRDLVLKGSTCRDLAAKLAGRRR